MMLAPTKGFRLERAVLQWRVRLAAIALAFLILLAAFGGWLYLQPDPYFDANNGDCDCIGPPAP